MLFRSLTFWLCSIIFSTFAQAQTPDLNVKFEGGHDWQMTTTLKDEFSNFLETHMLAVRSKVKTLYWPALTDKADLKEVMASAFYPGSEKYKNRPLQCAFIQKVLASTTGNAHDRFSNLTKNGSVCIQFDLPSSEWTDFTKNLMDFFWTEKWIANGSESWSLEDLAKRAFGAAFRRPEFFIATHLEFDGYGWGYSDAELALFNSNPTLAKYASIAQTYDPNDKTPFRALGPEMEELLKYERSFILTSSMC
jgi:hypothetical protein